MPFSTTLGARISSDTQHQQSSEAPPNGSTGDSYPVVMNWNPAQGFVAPVGPYGYKSRAT